IRYFHVTGVQTCALPISLFAGDVAIGLKARLNIVGGASEGVHVARIALADLARQHVYVAAQAFGEALQFRAGWRQLSAQRIARRSEARRVGKPERLPPSP